MLETLLETNILLIIHYHSALRGAREIQNEGVDLTANHFIVFKRQLYFIKPSGRTAVS